MKKVLIITYYWPPSGGIGVQRWLKFAKYLPEFGWEPIVVIPQNPEYPLIDEMLLKEVNESIKLIKIPILEPSQILSKLKRKGEGKKLSAGFMSDSKKGILDKISIWIRSNVIIPDARRFWINPVYRGVSKFLEKNQIDYIITTGPPHSVHLAGLKVKLKFKNINWIADFRDPWTKIDFYKELKPNYLANWLHHYWEKKVVKSADIVLTVSDSNTYDYVNLGAKEVYTITNGFDPEDFSDTKYQLSKYFTIAHVGSFMANRNSSVLWEALSELIIEVKGFKEDIRLKFVGNVDFSIKKELREFGLIPYSKFIGFVTQKEAIEHQKSSHVLLLIINKTGNPKGMITGKIFGYLASLRQILLIGTQDGDAAKIIQKTESGLIADPYDKDQIKNCILDFYKGYKKDKDIFKGNLNEINKFSRRKLTKDLVNILNLKS